MSSILGILLLCPVIHAQIYYTRNFTEKLQAANVLFKAPLHTWYKVSTPCQDAYYSYDLCLVSERDSAELKFIILDEKETQKINFPNIHFMSKASHLATNDDAYWIRISPVPSQRILDTLNADWAGEVSFIPKKTVSDKRFGKMYSIFKEDTGMAIVMLYYNTEYSGFNQDLRSVTFNSLPTH